MKRASTNCSKPIRTSSVAMVSSTCGRSICYRLWIAGGFPVSFLLKSKPLDPGWARRLCSGSLTSETRLWVSIDWTNAPQGTRVWLGRVLTVLFVVAGCLIAPQLDNPKFGGVFQYIQQFQGYIWPGVVAAFLYNREWRLEKLRDRSPPEARRDHQTSIPLAA